MAGFEASGWGQTTVCTCGSEDQGEKACAVEVEVLKEDEEDVRWCLARVRGRAGVSWRPSEAISCTKDGSDIGWKEDSGSYLRGRGGVRVSKQGDRDGMGNMMGWLATC